jgi:four helix bundle protein
MKSGESDLKTRTKTYARRIIRLFVTLPKETAAQVLGRQMLRSGTSVGANYREASRGRPKAEFIAEIGDCLREIDETAYWLELLADEKFVPAARLSDLLDETDQFPAIFVAVLKSSKGL